MTGKRKQAPKKKVVKRKSVSKAIKKENSLFFDRINNFITKKSFFFLVVSLIVCVLTSLLLFDLKVSLGGDDSSYIARAYNIIHRGIYPSAQGPLYPFILSLPVAIFGIKLGLLKILSLVFILVHLVLFDKALSKIAPPIIRIITIFLIAVNSYIAFFASSTYNEAFFLMLQSIFFLFFVNNFIVSSDSEKDTVNLKTFVLFGFILLAMAQTRFISLGVFTACVIYFLLYRQWKKAGAAFASFSIFYVGFSLLKKLFVATNGMSKQLEVLLLKHPYKPDLGNEDVMGYFTRIVDNSNLYLGRTFLVESGLRPIKDATINGSLTVLVYLILIAGFIFAFKKKDKGIVFSYLYAGGFSLLTFVVLQKYWDQNRMIIIMYPFLWMLCLYLLYQIFSLKKLRSFQSGFLIIAILLTLPSIGRTFTKVGEHSTTLRKNLSGDKLYGLTEDWVNYIKAAQWANDYLPDDEYVSVRKPQIAFIYTGKIHRGGGLKETDPKKALEYLAGKDVTHIIRASLRRDPDRRTAQVINTVHNYMARIERAYPGTFKLVHTEGNVEVAQLFEINYYGIGK